MPRGKQRADGTWENPPTGVPEEVLEWTRVDNGATKRDWWRHAHRTDKDPPLQVCGAKLRRGTDDRNVYYVDEDGESVEKRRRCSIRDGLFPNGRCHRHNGAGDGGAAVVHGRYAQGVRGPLGRATRRAEEDRQILDLKPTIGLFDERLAELSQRIEDEGDTPDFRRIALRLFRELLQAEKDKDVEMAKHFRKELRLHLEQGTRADQQWTQLLNTAERRAKRAETANMVLLRGAEVISKTEATWLLARMVDIVEGEASGAAATRIKSRFAQEILGRVDPEAGRSKEIEAGPPLPGVPGEGTGVPEEGARGEALGVSANGDGDTLPPREVQCEDITRSREDSGGGVDRADVPDDEGGQHRDLDGADGSSGEEPAVGGDREDAREGDRGTPW